MTTIHPQFITDSKGKKVSAIIPIKEYNRILEELEDFEDIVLYDESKKDNDPAISKFKAMQLIAAERKKNGL